MIRTKCRESCLPLFIVEGSNHSLEIPGDTRRNLEIMAEVMEGTQSYIADTVWYRRLAETEQSSEHVEREPYDCQLEYRIRDKRK